ncbi:hypothetical protein FB550_102443 [Neobacillus bataviensis]|uniref:AP2 domain-containing protein n=1 Tax=Neobacillus bataviensis TaxID=220685 RepID=A0A561DST2_9BACI|nr:hypothetical protein [Neobacillus bataviensis]TWE06421.1 hypothetical protein FB550_102443 [Neobacillus bataviensis]
MENQVVEQVLENVVLPAKQKRAYFKSQSLERVGAVKINNYGSLMVIDEYNNSQDVWVRFPQGHLVHCTWQQFVTGSVKNVYDRSVFGVGFIGEGDYKPSIDGVMTPQYLTWIAMMMRCYSTKFKEKQPTYKDCTVSEEWHNFQNFCKWYDKNNYEIDGYRMHLDKDILVKGNKLYSSSTCVFVPQFINTLFLKRAAKRGSLPIGVKRCSGNPKKYEVQCRSNSDSRGYIGVFNTPEEAFYAYKEFKENHIKKVAKEHKDHIPHVLYNAMCNYIVEIND